MPVDGLEPFQRWAGSVGTGTGTGDGSGWGLGLSIARSVTVAYHGQLCADSRPDGGLEIVVSLPVSAGPRTRRH